MITERTLKKWRREALRVDKFKASSKTMIETVSTTSADELRSSIVLSMIEEQVLQERILRLTQVLLDQHLLNK